MEAVLCQTAQRPVIETGTGNMSKNSGTNQGISGNRNIGTGEEAQRIGLRMAPVYKV